jgi:hypothetical protein
VVLETVIKNINRTISAKSNLIICILSFLPENQMIKAVNIRTLSLFAEKDIFGNNLIIDKVIDIKIFLTLKNKSAEHRIPNYQYLFGKFTLKLLFTFVLVFG